MLLSVDVVNFVRRLGPQNTQVEMVWHFNAAPSFLTELKVLDWGDGFSGTFTPPNPVLSYTHIYTYAPSLDAQAGYFGVASFTVRLGGTYGFGPIANVALSLTPDAEEGVLRVMAPINLNSVVVGGFGDDTLIGGARQDTIYAGFGDDSVLGGAWSDRLFGERGNDTLIGEAGADELTGNAGDDLLDGGSYNDTLSGVDGADTLFGGSGGDFLLGGEGDDRVNGGSGNDTLLGNAGADTLLGDAGADELTGNAGDDSLDGGSNNDFLSGLDGADTLFGNSGKDFLQGDEGNDRLNGGSGNDTLLGGDGADTIYSSSHADLVLGGLGADRLISTSDGARDVFLYNSLAEGGDRITGFVNDEDVIHVEFADPGPLLVGAAPVADLPIGTYLFDTATSRFSYDPDGTGTEAPVLIATLSGVTSFSGNDFFFTL